jgi:hypothetical protein
MLEEFSKHPKISEFLHLYPKSEWKSCIQSILIIGINTLETTFKKFIPVDELEYLSDSTPLPLRLQLPDLKQTLSSMKEAIDRINNSLEKENDDCRHRSSSRKVPRPKKLPPNPILLESTPRFKVLDDAFNKQKWKKEASVLTVKEDTRPALSSKPRPKSSLKSASLTKKIPKPTNIEFKAKIEAKALKLPAEGGFTERNYTGSPTLEELLSNSRFTVREEGKSGRGETFLANSELKQSFESSLNKKGVRDSSLTGQKNSAVSIAEGFLKNPLIFQLGFKRDDEKIRTIGRSCSPLTTLDST